MKSRLLGGLAALLLAIVGTVLMLNYAQAADSRAQQGLEPVQVLVVQKSVPAGTPVSELADSVALTSLPRSAVPVAALDSLSDAVGKVSAIDLHPGEQILAARLVDPEALSAPGTVPVPAGMEEVSVLLEPQRVTGGRLAAGDTVGVFVSVALDEKDASGAKQYTKQIFHNVLVTSVQQDPPAEAQDAKPNEPALPSGSIYVTLARHDADAAKIVFSAEFGKIWLSKETPDSKVTSPDLVTVEKVFQ